MDHADEGTHRSARCDRSSGCGAGPGRRDRQAATGHRVDACRSRGNARVRHDQATGLWLGKQGVQSDPQIPAPRTSRKCHIDSPVDQDPGEDTDADSGPNTGESYLAEDPDLGECPQ